MTEQLPLMGPLKGPCEGDRERCARGPSDCPMFGTLLKANRDGRRRIRGCGDPTARGVRNRRSGLAKQSKARRKLGVAPQKFGDANEERWQDPLFDNEIKSGAQVRPAFTVWVRCEAQIRANDPDHGGQRKPARVVLMPDDFGGDGITMTRLSTWETIIRPALESYYGELF